MWQYTGLSQKLCTLLFTKQFNIAQSKKIPDDMNTVIVSDRRSFVEPIQLQIC